LADDNAVRQRRKRLHAAGDHSMCRRCAAVAGGAPASIVALPAPEPGAALDAVAEMRRLALRLVAAHEGDPQNAVLARELRMTLRELMPNGAGAADADLTGLFAALQA
jgi:hypothetical protein